MIDSKPNRDLTQATMVVLGIGMLILITYWIIRPLLLSFLWAAMIVVATWPILLRIQRALWGKRGLAVAVMTTGLLLTLILPLTFAVVAIISNADRVVGLVKALEAEAQVPPPAWLHRLPVAGPGLAAAWEEFASSGPKGMISQLAPYTGKVVGWFVARIGEIGVTLAQFLITVVMAAILYSRGEVAALGIRRFVGRLAGSRGDHAAAMAARAVRGVAYGIVLTALIQSVVGGIGLAIAGVPGSMVLAAIMLLCCIAQLGAPPVLVPSVIWLYWTGQAFCGTFLLFWTVIVTSIDNFLRPFLIKKGADLPLLLVFTGVIGGIISLGIIGIFIGPAVLAVAWALAGAWMEAEQEDAAPSSAAGG